MVCDMRRVVQLGWKSFELVGDGSNGRCVTIFEHRDGFCSSIALEGFEIRWIVKKLQEAAKGIHGWGFMGSLRGRGRLIEFSRLRNWRGTFVEVKISFLSKIRKVCIPDLGDGKGPILMAKMLLGFISIGGKGRKSMPHVTAACNHFSDDRVMTILGHIFLGHLGATKVPIKEIETICEWIDKNCGRSKSTIDDLGVGVGDKRRKFHEPIGDYSSHSSYHDWEHKVVEQVVWGKLDNGGTEKMAVHGAVGMENMAARKVNFRKASGKPLESSEHGILRDLVSRRVIAADKSHNRRVWNAVGSHSKFQNKNSRGAFIWRVSSTQSGCNLINRNLGASKPLFSMHERSKLCSTVVGQKNYVWVQKNKLSGGHDYKEQNAVLKPETFEVRTSKVPTKEKFVEIDKEDGGKSPIRGVEPDNESKKICHEKHGEKSRGQG